MKQLVKPLLLSIAIIPAINLKAQELADFFLPIPIQKPLVSEGVWGDESVVPRDTTTGLEDRTLKKWVYWDGSIVKTDDGKYHMYASRWAQSFQHGDGWTEGSQGMHAVSDNLIGPYKDTGAIWPQWRNGKGHNVIGLRTKDGKYAAVASEIVEGQIFIADKPEGPFKILGEIQTDPNGYYEGWVRYNELDFGAVSGNGVGRMANVMIIERHDGRYMLLARHCMPMVSEGGILGPYKAMGERAWWGVEGIPQFRNEDPTIWYSDGMYHIVVNHYGKDHSYHLTSEDGFDNWRVRGSAYRHDKDIFRYEDGTVNNWYTVQRPTVYVEDEKIKAFNFSVIDVHKGWDGGNDNHGSKIMVVPFDGDAFGKHIKDVVEAENRSFDNTPLPSPWSRAYIGKSKESFNCGWDAEKETIRMNSNGRSLKGDSDNLPFLYQEKIGDISLTTKVLCQYFVDEEIESGIMIRSDLDPRAPFFSAMMSNKNGLLVKARDKANGNIKTLLQRLDIKAPYWLRAEKRGSLIKLFVSTSNHMNWDLLMETEIDLGENYLAGLTSINDDKDASLARFKSTDLHNYGQPLKGGIVNHTFPDSIPASGKIDFTIEIEETQALDIWITLQNTKTLEYEKPLFISSQRRYKPINILEATYEIDGSLDPNSSYWFTIKATPMHFHESEALQASFKRVNIIQ